MAEGQNNTTNIEFSEGEIQKRINKWLADVSTESIPGGAFLKCPVDNVYTKNDWDNVKLSLYNIVLEAEDYESQRLLNTAKEFGTLINKAECMGEDYTIAYGLLYETALAFVNYYNDNKSSFILKSSVNQNPNYYNV